jgi:hypothetical protein
MRQKPETGVEEKVKSKKGKRRYLSRRWGTHRTKTGDVTVANFTSLCVCRKDSKRQMQSQHSLVTCVNPALFNGKMHLSFYLLLWLCVTSKACNLNKEIHCWWLYYRLSNHFCIFNGPPRILYCCS